MSEIDDYLAKVANPQKQALQRIRQTVQATAPDAVEVITYGMPGFKYKGKYLVAFAPFKDHMSLFPGGEAIGKLDSKLDGYVLSKGTIQFTIDHPLPDELITEIIALRMADIDRQSTK